VRSRTVGVEEELLLIDADTGETRPDATKILAELHRRGSVTPAPLPDAGPVPGGTVEGEFQEQQLETATRPVESLEELYDELRGGRRTADEGRGAHRRASGSPGHLTGGRDAPDHGRPPVSGDAAAVRADGGGAADLWLPRARLCGVGVRGGRRADRIRVWLPTLLAISSNSPFWQGRDSGFASFRSQAWNRWPCSGPTDIIGSAARYRDTVAAMIATQVPLDQRMVYSMLGCPRGTHGRGTDRRCLPPR